MSGDTKKWNAVTHNPFVLIVTPSLNNETSKHPMLKFRLATIWSYWCSIVELLPSNLLFRIWPLYWPWDIKAVQKDSKLQFRNRTWLENKHTTPGVAIQNLVKDRVIWQRSAEWRTESVMHPNAVCGRTGIHRTRRRGGGLLVSHFLLPLRRI